MEDQAEKEKAKEIFAHYSGSMFEMHRGGKYQDYKAYDISKETEIEWFIELIEKYSLQLSIRDWVAVASLSMIAKNYQDQSIVENVVSFASRNIMSADSIVRLMFAEGMVEIIRLNKKVISKDQLFNACKVTVQILQAVISEPLVIDPGHELEKLHLKDKRSLNLRANKSVEEVKELLN